MAERQRNSNVNRILKARTAQIILLSILSLMCAGLLRTNSTFERIELRVMDMAHQFSPLRVPHEDRVVIIAIDDLSLAVDADELGKWAWPRSAYAPVLEYLTAAGARVVGFDIYFPLRSRDPADDDQLVRAVLENGMTCQAVTCSDRHGKPNDSVVLTDLRDRFSVSCDLPISSFDRIMVPFVELREACDCLGQINAPRDVDGAKRRISMIAQGEGVQIPSLALSMWLFAHDLYPEDIVCESGRLILGDGVRSIPIAEDGTSLLRFGNTERDFIPFSSVLHAGLSYREGQSPDFERRGLPPVSAKDFEDKVVIIALTASGLFDLFPTPMGTVPGVEMHAWTYENIEYQGFFHPLKMLVAWGMAVVLVGIGVVALVRFPTVIALLTGFTAAMLLGIVDLGLIREGFWLDLTLPWTAFTLSEISVVVLLFVAEGREKRRYRATFSRYVSKQVVEELLQSDRRVSLGGEKRTITVLFCDIRGFTTFSEGREPEEVVGILNEFLGEMVDEVFTYGGTLDKFLGDGMMVFFGAPNVRKDHAEQAVRCGMKMLKRLEQLNVILTDRGLQSLRIGIGIHTGSAIVGNIGSKERMEYTAIGDTVNTASRIQSLNKDLETNILVTEATVKSCDSSIHFKQRGLHSIRGKVRGVEVFEPLFNAEEDDA